MSPALSLTTDMKLVLGLVGLTMVLFLFDRVRADVVALVVLVLLGLTGLVVSLVNERSVRTLKQLVAPGTVLQEKIVYAQQFIDAPVAAPRTNKRRRTKTQTAKQHKHNKS